MWNQKGNSSNGNRNNKGNEKKDEPVAVAIDKDKGSQYALKWAVDNLLARGSTVTLIHIKQRPSSIPTPSGSQVSLSEVHDGVAKAFQNQVDHQVRELFLPYRAFCSRKDITCKELIIEDTDVVKALCNFVKDNFIASIVLGSPSRSSFVRFRTSDVASNVSKGAPLFCSVYIISKGKISSVRSSTLPLPNPPPRPLPAQVNHASVSIDTRPQQPMQQQSNNGQRASNASRNHSETPVSAASPDRTPFVPTSYLSEDSQIKSPFNRHKRSGDSIGSYGDISMAASDISFVSSGRPSTERTNPYESDDFSGSHWPSSLPYDYGSESDSRSSFGSIFSATRFSSGDGNPNGFSASPDNSFSGSSSQNLDEVEAEMRRLKQELKQTMDMYSSACKEAISAKQKAMELQRWKMEEEAKLEEARLSEEAALAIAEKEKAKTRAAIEAAEAAQRIAELEAKKRISAEKKALKEAEEKKKVLDTLAKNDIRYRKYTIEEIETATENFSKSRKIGEGGYGPVYKCNLDHTPVAVKVLRPDAAQGRSQFQQEVEVLSCIRHPNMVLLLGACPEYGCLVYEYMANGSLEDCLVRKGNTPPLSWQLRFRIAAEIATGLLFLHQTKPEPLVHRDLKPGNILLDRNFVSKISDVGLARLVPPSVADTVTQYRMTSTAGTFCYIDPEYQQTGMLGIKSDIYSLGIMLLQIITAKPPMGLTHHVERSIEKGTFREMLDPAVPDWPVEEALIFAKIALQCAELRRKDRPDLKTVVLPELNRLKALAEDSSPNSATMFGNSTPGTSPSHSQYSSSREMISSFEQSGYQNSQSPLASSSSSS